MTIQPSLARLVIGVTGHRDPLPEHERALRRDVRTFFGRLQVDFPDLGLQVVSALAAGGDQLVAEEALALDIPVLAPLPMPQGDYERDFEEPAALERFRALVARCDVLSLPVAGEDATSRAGSQRERQYVQVGEFIASHCQILLALWNGEPSDAPGGTADVVRFHCETEKPGHPQLFPVLL